MCKNYFYYHRVLSNASLCINCTSHSTSNATMYVIITFMTKVQKDNTVPKTTAQDAGNVGLGFVLPYEITIKFTINYGWKWCRCFKPT